VVEFLEGDLPTQGIGLAFIYCNHKENQAQCIEYFLGAITRQILERGQVIPKDVHTLYGRHRGKETKPTRAEYLELLKSLAKECSEVYIVIDALDECIDRNGRIIWRELITKLTGTVHNIRLLYTSRQIDDIAGILKKLTRIEIQATDEDLRTYVLEQVESKDDLADFCQDDSTLQENIVQAVVSKAQGM